MAKVFTTAHVPDALQQAWLQHLRDFDAAHPDCHFEVAIDAPERSLAEMVEIMRVSPGLSFQQIVERKISDDEALIRQALSYLLRPETEEKAVEALVRIVLTMNSHQEGD